MHRDLNNCFLLSKPFFSSAILKNIQFIFFFTDRNEIEKCDRCDDIQDCVETAYKSILDGAGEPLLPIFYTCEAKKASNEDQIVGQTEGQNGM